MTASIAVSVEYDLASIAESAGQTDASRRKYSEGVFYVQGVSQSALDGALAAYDHLAAVKARKKADLATLRYEKEIAGKTVSGIPVATDRSSQGKYTAARIVAKEDSNYTVKWKANNGFIELNATQIIAVADAVRVYVQDCFDNEADHVAAIDLLTTVAEVDAYDITTKWPS